MLDAGRVVLLVRGIIIMQHFISVSEISVSVVSFARPSPEEFRIPHIPLEKRTESHYSTEANLFQSEQES